MRSYTQIVPTFWSRGSGKKLRGNPPAQVLALYLMTCPNANMIGLYYLPFVTIESETGLTNIQLSESFESIKEIASYDRESEMVWIPEFANYQLGESLSEKDQRYKTVIKQLRMIDSRHKFFSEFMVRYGKNYCLQSVTGLTNISNWSNQLIGQTNISQILEKGQNVIDFSVLKPLVPDPVLIPVPDQIQDLPNKLDLTRAPAQGLESQVEQIFKFWQKHMNKQSSKLDDKRKAKIKQALADFEPRDLCYAILGAKRDDFLMGRDPKTNGKKFNDFNVIFRDVPKIEGLIEIYHSKANKSAGIENSKEDIANKQAEFESSRAKKIARDKEFAKKLLGESVKTEYSPENLANIIDYVTK